MIKKPDNLRDSIMLRANRRISAMGVFDVNVSNIGVSRDGGLVQATSLRKGDSNARMPYHHHHMTHTLSTMKGTIISHLLTSFATALLMIIISSMYNGQDKMGKPTSLNRIDTIQRTLNLDDKARRLRHGDIALEKIKSIISSSPFYDVTVVGSGPAGLTASIFAARAGLNVLVIGSETGLLSEATSLDNFPSWYTKSTITTVVGASDDVSNGGMAWLATTKLQAVATGVHFVTPGLKVSNIARGTNNLFTMNVSGITIDSATIILATGATGRKLNVRNEELLWGKKIHSCAICDGPSYQNKSVVVIGGGDAAIDAAILLSRHARDVVIVHRRETFRASNQLNLKALLTIPKVTVKTPFVVDEFMLKDFGTPYFGVRVRNTQTNKTEILDCEGAFIMIGSTPNTQFVSDFVKLDDEGYIETPFDSFSDSSTRTSVDGVFAAGEITDKHYKQAITAASAGAKAAIDAERWLRQQMPDTTSIQRRIPGNIPLQSFDSATSSADDESINKKAEVKGMLDVKNDCIDLTNSDCIKELVDRYPVVMFAKARCPYCVQALEMLKIEGALESVIHVLNIDGPDEDVIRSNLEIFSGRRTVPNIFIGGRNVGGIVLLNRLQKRGELHFKLKEVDAIQQDGSSSDILCNDFRRTECIEEAVRKFPVVVFSKSWCPYCRKALEALSLEGVSKAPFLFVVDLDELDTQTIQSNLARMTGRRTVPNVFIGGHSIGGGDETVQLQSSGELRMLLVRAKAIPDA